MMFFFFSFFGFIVQNDSLAMIFIALKYEYSKFERNRIQIHYQLKFDMPQAGYSCIKYDTTEVETNLTVAENLVDAPIKEWSLGCCQGDVKQSNII
jgi:hypothetical protein